MADVFVAGPIVVGAGPSGMAVAACLDSMGIPAMLIEREDCIASLWQLRTYDRLHLHLPKEFCELPLMPFPEWYPAYPNRRQFVDYLQDYARAFNIRPHFGEEVIEAEFDTGVGLWRVRTAARDDGEGRNQSRAYLSRWLVVATGENAEAVVPELPGAAEFKGPMVHAITYKSGNTYRDQRVLVVGCGNTGMEVSLDLSNSSARPTIAVRSSIHVLPREMWGFSTFGISMRLLKWLPVRVVDWLLLLGARIVMGDTNRLGLPRPKLGPMELKSVSGKTPVLDVGTVERIRSGRIEVRPSIEKLTKHGAEFVDGRVEEFDAVILATGYQSNVPFWLKDDELFNKNNGMPKRKFPNGWKGERGLYSVGFTNRGLLGASMDARKVAEDILRCWKLEMKNMTMEQDEIAVMN